MKKDLLVVFTKNNARLITNPSKRVISQNKNSLLNPSLTKVMAVPPHLWKVNGEGEIVPMTPGEQKIRLAHIKRYGLDNSVPASKTKRASQNTLIILRLLADMLIVCVAVGLGYFIYKIGVPNFLSAIEKLFS